ncbi:MAG: DUF1444 family protein [Gammaproteobacteria bacterium]|nr:DUF1444 family protein [Gammaproteobacteria bacterium]MBT8109762.1 DUF1444 family protein [Gammaproteobacteria bacterium]NND47476.1 DUF1444 family protein [Woeseiaceae bacterium]NNL44463.1 DUF1444 family protein [Woeseiaceae bacterium]
MFRLTLLFTLFAATALHAADPLSQKHFTARYAEAVEAAYAGAKVEVVGDLEVEVSSGDEQSTRSFLDNAYKSYQADPEAIDDILQRYVAALNDMLNPDPRNDIGRLFPVIKDNTYITEIKAVLRQSEGYDPSDPFPFYYEQLNRELVVMYAFDSETGISMASADDVEAFGIAGPALRARAVENLMNYLPGISREGSNRLSLVKADGNYEASLILAEDIWTRDNFDVAGDIVIFVPSRDVLMVTGSKDVEGLAVARELIASNEWPYFISGHGFVRTSEGWVVFDKP